MRRKHGDRPIAGHRHPRREGRHREAGMLHLLGQGMPAPDTGAVGPGRGGPEVPVRQEFVEAGGGQPVDRRDGQFVDRQHIDSAGTCLRDNRIRIRLAEIIVPNRIFTSFPISIVSARITTPGWIVTFFPILAPAILRMRALKGLGKQAARICNPRLRSWAMCFSLVI